MEAANPLKINNHMNDEDFNDALTIESMLQVVDAKSGKQADVRALLNIKHEDIKDDRIKAHQISLSNPKDLEDYLAQLDVIDYNMGKFDDDESLEESKVSVVTDPKNTWSDWWEQKQN
jgi:hypothetical protein